MHTKNSVSLDNFLCSLKEQKADSDALTKCDWALKFAHTGIYSKKI